jgi:hypothetical protein
MNLVRRSGAPSAFASLLALALGVTCAAMTACSAASGSSSGGWPSQSGGGPLGGGSNDESSGASSGSPGSSGSAGSSSGSPAAGGGNDASLGTGGDATGAGGDGAATAADGGPREGGDEGAVDSPAEAAPATEGFTLVDTAITGIVNGSPVPGFDPMAEGTTVNLALVGSALSIRANTIPAIVGSVAFALDATYTHTENAAPYFLCSDNGDGGISSCATVLTVGKHSLSATPFSGTGLTGDAGAPILLDFTIVDVADAGGDGPHDAAGQ